MDLADLSGATSLPTDDFDTSSISNNSKRGQIMLTPDEPGGFETGNGNRNSDNEIHLPHSESIPQQFWTVACGWIPIVGRDIVACLFSRDWQVIYFLQPFHLIDLVNGFTKYLTNCLTNCLTNYILQSMYVQTSYVS